MVWEDFLQQVAFERIMEKEPLVECGRHCTMAEGAGSAKVLWLQWVPLSRMAGWPGAGAEGSNGGERR